MDTLLGTAGAPLLLDEGSDPDFRRLFGELLAGSTRLDTAALRIRLGAVDLTERETRSLQRLRVLVGEVNALTLEEEAYALLMDPGRTGNLLRVAALLRRGLLEIRAAPLAGWSPDFSVFSGPDGPTGLLLGLHWFQRPFPHRGPAWAVRFGPAEAVRAHARFEALWRGAHEIGPAVLGILERALHRGRLAAENPPATREKPLPGALLSP